MIVQLVQTILFLNPSNNEYLGTISFVQLVQTILFLNIHCLMDLVAAVEHIGLFG